MKNLILLFCFFGFIGTNYTQTNRYYQPAPAREYHLYTPPTDMMLDLIKVQQEREEAAQKEAFKAKYRGRIHIYGGISSHDTYLGCLNCPGADPLSIWNSSGDYGFGGRYNRENIWNESSPFGGSYSNNSPWNTTATNPPACVDFDGAFYGYFTANKSKNLRTEIEFFLAVVDDYREAIAHYNEIARIIE